MSTILKIDHSNPFSGKPVLIVNGAYRGQEGTIEKINVEKFSCVVTINSVSIDLSIEF